MVSVKTSTVLLTVLLLAVPALSQTQATLTGTLTDPAGAAIAGAEVTATPLDGVSGQAARTLTDGS